MVRRSCERLSGQGSSTEGRGERSLEPSRFWLAGAKAAYLRANLPEPSMAATAISQNLWIFREQSFLTEFGMHSIEI